MKRPRLAVAIVVATIVVIVVVGILAPRFFLEKAPAVLPPVDFLAAPITTTSCRDRYRGILGPGPVDLRVVFGYKDARPARFVGDGYEKTLFVSYLVAPCRAGSLACGFRRDDDDGDLFTREIIGPDKKPLRVRLTVVASSASPDDDENRKDPFQRWRSHQAEEIFLGGLGAADIVFYDGHSRDGGGPDFAPPRLARGQHVDYPWYASKRPGVALLQKGLGRQSATGTKLLGLFSCASDRHFVGTLRREHPRLALISSRQLLYWADAMRGLLGAINGILGQWCPSDLDAAVRATTVGGTTHVTGLFD